MGEPGTAASPRWTRKRVAAVTAGALFFLALALLTFSAGSALFVLFAGVVVGTALRPAVEALGAWRLPRWAASLLVFLAFGTAVVSGIYFLVPLVADQVSTVAAKLPAYYRSAREAMRGSSSVLLRHLSAQLPASPAKVGDQPEAVASVVEQGFEYLTLLPRLLLIVSGVVVVAYYWCVERPIMVRLLSLMPSLDRRDDVRAFLDAAEERVGSYVRGQIVVCLLVGVLASIAYWLIGLPYALLLGLAAAILEIVPFVGPLLGAAPAFAVALSISPTAAIWVMVAATGVQAIENYVLAPRVLGRSVGVSPFALILAVVCLTSLFGAPGAILGVPMAAVLQLAAERFVIAPTLEGVGADVGRDQPSAARYEARQVGLAARRLIFQGTYAVDAPPFAVVEEVEAVAEGLAHALETHPSIPPAAGGGVP